MVAKDEVKDPVTAEDVREQIADEWGDWIAKDVIFLHGVRAFNAGDAVPRGHVDSKVVSADQVEKRK